MITSHANPRVKQIIQWQNKAKERREAGIFLTEGFKMFQEAPEEQLVQVYVSEAAEEKIGREASVRDKLNRVGYEKVSEDVFARMSDTRTPQGILCVARRPVSALKQLLEAESPLLVILEDIQDPGNLGTIIRTGEGAGITGVIMSGRTADVYNPKTIRATMGSVFRVPFLYVESIPETVSVIHKRGIHTYAAHLDGELSYIEGSYREPTAFLIGNEGNGLSPETAGMAEQYLKIPMEGSVESLNAAVAAALLMYEAHRQRQ